MMKTRLLTGLALVGFAASWFAGGCGGVAALENEVTWAVKAMTDNLTAATATEWQAVAEVIDRAVPEADLTLSDEQAQAIVDFVQENEINSIQDIVDTIEQAQEDPSSIVIPDSFLALFGNFTDDDYSDLLSTLQQ